jgi:hypothetical protein
VFDACVAACRSSAVRTPASDAIKWRWLASLQLGARDIMEW